MKIQGYKPNNVSFKGSKTIQVFTENPKNADFIGNVALNSAVETMKSNSKVSFLPAGSWISGNNFDAALSDHDFTILLPNDTTYQKMEAELYDAKECLKDSVTKKLKFHNIPEERIQSSILPTINVFPTPQIKECFNSYDQYRDLTNLKISLHDNVDTDTGLWRMKGVVLKHFENEGSLLYLKKDGKIGFVRIKDHKPEVSRYLSKKGIYLQKENKLYSSDKLNIINEFIEKMQDSEPISSRQFFKYLNRVKKFFFIESEDDLFLVGNDPRKNTQPKFEKRITIEKEYQDQFRKIAKNFSEIKTEPQDLLPEQFTKKTLKELELFKRLAEEILSWPTLRGFKLH